MSRALVIVGLLAVATQSHADPAPHATGTWLELDLDSNLGGSSAGIDDLPTHHLVIGAQTESFAIGVAVGGEYVTSTGSSLTLVEFGPTARYTLATTPERDTELVAEGGLLISILAGENGADAVESYTFQAGLEVRHWIDRHFAIGGGIVGHVVTESESGESVLGLGLVGAVRVTSVF